MYQTIGAVSGVSGLFDCVREVARAGWSAFAQCSSNARVARSALNTRWAHSAPTANRALGRVFDTAAWYDSRSSRPMTASSVACQPMPSRDRTCATFRQRRSAAGATSLTFAARYVPPCSAEGVCVPSCTPLTALANAVCRKTRVIGRRRGDRWLAIHGRPPNIAHIGPSGLARSLGARAQSVRYASARANTPTTVTRRRCGSSL